MQKKLIALAVAAVISAPAFADVTPYGIIDGGVANISGDGQKSQLAALSGGASTSRLGVKVTEDLGNGLTAVGVLEYGLDTETNQTAAPTITTTTGTTAGTTTGGVGAASTSSAVSNLAARQQMLALAGSFGTVATGYLQTTGYDFQGKFDPLAGSSASPLQSMNQSLLIGTAAAGARAQRALAYISPEVVPGLSFAVNYSTAFSGLGNVRVANTAADANITAALASANYAAGPLAVSVVYAGVNYPTSANSNEIAAGASFDFGAAKLLGTYQRNTGAVGAVDTAMSVSGVVPLGADAVAVSYAKRGTEVANAGGSGYTVGYLHTLSKTTTVYAAYEAVTNESAVRSYSVDNNLLSSGTTLSLGGKSSLIGFGMRKKF
jgi:predicted porin